MAVTIGTYGALDDSGWSSFTLPAGAVIWYVAANGSDSNNGHTVSTPLLNVSTAVAQLRRGVGDWVLLRRGDTFPESTIYNLHASGSNVGGVISPIVFGSYDPSVPGVVNPNTVGKRPVWLVGSGQNQWYRDGGGTIITGDGDYIAFVGIDIYYHTRDPFGADYINPVSADGGFYFNSAISMNWLLVEDCRISFAGQAFGFSAQRDTVYNNVTVRRCIFYNIYTYQFNNPNAASTVISGGNWNNLLWEENICFKTGWNHDVTLAGGGSRGSTYYDHCMYVSAYPPDTSTVYGPETFRGGIYAEDATGPQHRDVGTLLFNNFTVRCTFGWSCGSCNLGPIEVSYNVCTEQVDRTLTPPDTTQPDIPIQGVSAFQPDNLIGTINFHNNLACGMHLTNRPTVGLAWFGGNISNNVLYNVGDGTAYGSGTIQWSSGTVFTFDAAHITCTGPANAVVTRCDLTTTSGTGSGCAVQFTVNATGNGVAAGTLMCFTGNDGSGNDWWHGGEGYTPGGFNVGSHLHGTFSGGSIDLWVQTINNMTDPSTTNNSVDNNGDTTGGSFHFPMHGYNGTIMGNCTVAAYCTANSISPATTAGFLNAVTGGNPAAAFSTWGQGQTRSNWQYKLTAAAINKYFRQGFNMAEPGGAAPGFIVGDQVLDFGLNKLSQADKVHLCSAMPLDYASVISTSLGNKNLGVGNVFGAIQSGVGRERVTVAFSGGSVTGTGAAGYWAAVDSINSLLMAAGNVATSRAVSSGQQFSMPAITVGLKRS
jgi:hypothetical protein